MSRGRKPKSGNTNLNWQEYFNKNVGIYLQSIIIELGQLKKISNERGDVLLQSIKKQRTKKKEINLPQIRSEEIPFRIPENWVWCRLGEIIEFTDNLNIEAVFTKDTLINYVDIDAIDNQNHKIRESKLKPVSELSSRARRVLKKGYIMYSLVRPYLNNIAIIEKEHPNHIGSTGFAVFNGIEVNNKYLKYILLSDYVRQLFLSMLSGFNSPTITQEQFNSTPIPLPPISEQNLILDFLSDLEKNCIEISSTYFNGTIEKKIVKLHNSQLLSSELFSELETQLTLLENLNQAILQEAVQGKLVPQDPNDEPAGELLKRIKLNRAGINPRPMKELPPIKAEEIPFEIPKSWVWCRLGEICSKIGSGSTPKGSNYSKTGYPFFRSQNIYNDGLVYDDITFISDDVQKQMSGTVVLPQDILLNITGGSMGRCAIVPNNFEEGNVSQHVCIIRPLQVDRNYFHKIILSPYFQKFIFSSTTGAGREGLPKYNLEQFVIPLPPLAEQKRIVAEIERQMDKTKELKEHIVNNQKATEQLLKALLHDAFEIQDERRNSAKA